MSTLSKIAFTRPMTDMQEAATNLTTEQLSDNTSRIFTSQAMRGGSGAMNFYMDPFPKYPSFEIVYNQIFL